MSDAKVKIDYNDEEFKKLLNRLTDKEAKRAFNQGIRKTLAILRKGVKDEMKKALNPHRKGRMMKDTAGNLFMTHDLRNDVNLKVYKRVDGGMVGLTNSKKKQNRAYLLRYLNCGTGPRATKKRANRGSIEARDFFEKGIASSKGRALAELDKKISEAIQKQADKKR